MRNIVLIAAVMLTSAAAQAGETRNLSSPAALSDPLAASQTKQLQAQNDTPAAAPDAPRYTPPPSETQTPADPARNISDAPRYNARPAPVDNTPPAASTATTDAAHPERRYDDRGYYDDAGYHPFPRRYADADRAADRSADRERPHAGADRPHHRARWTARRFIAELHRYGIYW